ncbi:MAG: ORF6N domain-containing protein [Candidatus Omnitrophota bacterium]
MKKTTALVKPEQIVDALGFIRGQRVILDADLARIYGVPSKRLNEQVKRNQERFPADFAFQLSSQELEVLRLQRPAAESTKNLKSQFATSSWGGRRYLPYAFTEHGAIMAANVLHSSRAVEMSVFVVRAFVKMRSVLSGNKKLAEELKRLEKKLTDRLDAHELAIIDVLRRLIKLFEPVPDGPEPKPKGPIGFQP